MTNQGLREYSLSNRAAEVRPSPLWELRKACRPTTVDLGFGEPNVPVADELLNDGFNRYRSIRTGYTKNGGIPELRDAIAAYRNLPYASSGANVVVTAGATQGLFATLLAVADAGDEVIVVEPAFFAYLNVARLLGLHVRLVELSAETDFDLDGQQFAEHIGPRTKAIILNSPCNPTGRIYGEKALRDLAAVAEQHGVWLICDETYFDIFFTEQAPTSIGVLSNRSIVVGSFSKSCSMTGFRIGYVAAPQPVSDAVVKVQQASIVCAPAVSQHVALTALSDPRRWMENARSSYLAPRAKMLSCLDERLGFRYIRNEGGFFVFVDIGELGISDTAFAHGLLTAADVFTVPGSVFGASGARFVRLSFSASEQDVETGLDRIASYVDTLDGDQSCAS